MEKASLASRRRVLMAEVGPRVVEIGSGTGANLGCYPAGSQLFATDPNPGMYPIQLQKGTGIRESWCFSAARAEALPFADGSIDSVVSTLVLCSVNNPGRAISEIWRILRPGGELVFLEHIRAEGRRGIWQDRLRLIWSWLGCGCHPNRQTLEKLSRQGFVLSQTDLFDPFASFSPHLRFFLRLVLPFAQGIALKSPGQTAVH